MKVGIHSWSAYETYRLFCFSSYLRPGHSSSPHRQMSFLPQNHCHSQGGTLEGILLYLLRGCHPAGADSVLWGSLHHTLPAQQSIQTHTPQVGDQRAGRSSPGSWTSLCPHPLPVEELLHPPKSSGWSLPSFNFLRIPSPSPPVASSPGPTLGEVTSVGCPLSSRGLSQPNSIPDKGIRGRWPLPFKLGQGARDGNHYSPGPS